MATMKPARILFSTAARAVTSVWRPLAGLLSDSRIRLRAGQGSEPDDKATRGRRAVIWKAGVHHRTSGTRIPSCYGPHRRYFVSLEFLGARPLVWDPVRIVGRAQTPL